jgi:competence ComEA-like helix-hairpin-helix protein
VLYPGPQLRLLILLALTLLVGLGVREWRAGFPDAADRLDRFDREDPAPFLPETAPVLSIPAGPAAPAARRAGPSTGAPAPLAASTPVPSPPAEPLDVNHADAAALARLPGVGAGLALRIVEERERRGRFDSPEALRDVLGMGPKKLAAIRPLITVRD